ncbi:metal-dependent hydrolase [Halorubrum halophilum]|uniref:metal-dependent hydrolase n=1 Tax=Halorubrum halophilum TaxID=413816 RepID=UPI00186AC08D|nr:metal-dependent hydrolase [Halorubrum halophilum]
MAEWLTHVLFAYALFTALSWTTGWIDQRWIAVAMIGSILPDLNRFRLVVSDGLMSYLVGVPFSWWGIHTIGGVLLLCGIGALLFETVSEERRAFASLLGGALLHVVVDLPQRYADGYMISSSYAFPVPFPRFPTPGWYVSSDRWVVVVAIVLAFAVFVADSCRETVEDNGES